MRLSIVSKGNASHLIPDVVFEGTFDELSDNFKNYRAGKGKHDGYFTRGELSGSRSNKNLDSAEVMVLDGDQSIDNEYSAPDPVVLHELLIKENINHFFYTTHSYDPPKKIKWRCVIECQMDCKEQLKPTLEKIFTFLHSHDYPLVNVKENWTWSQAWFLPNRDKDDGKYIFLKYMDGEPYIAEEPATVSVKNLAIKKNTGFQYDDTASYADNITAIRNGISYYKELQNVLYGMAKDGRAQAVIECDAEMIMLASKASKPDHPEHEKWQKRFDLIPTYVQQAVDCEKDDEFEEVNLDDIEIKEQNFKNNDLDFPPGLMGELCEDFYDMSPHPNKEIALVGGFGLVAGITGRKYNVMGTGLNIYATLLADSGIGKSAIKNGINKAIRESGTPSASTFAGSSRFTGPRAVFDMLSTGMSRVCVLEEAGLINESSAGDSSGLNRVMLDLYTSSGAGEYAGGEAYSDSKNSIPILPSPALTVVNISTPKSYLQAMKNKGAELSGEIARMWLTRSVKDKTYLNTKRKKRFSKDVHNRINELIQFCVNKQDPNKPDEIIDIDCDGIDLQAESNKWVDKENEYRSQGDILRRTIASRAFIKTLKLASVCSVFNGYNCIGEKEFEWAQNAVQTESELIQQTFMFEATDDLSDVVMNIVCPVIVKLLKGGYGDLKVSPNPNMRKMGVFSKSNITQALKMNKLLKELDDDPARNNPRTGLEKAIDYMIRNDLIIGLKADALKLVKRKTKSRSNQLYKITDSFQLAMED